MARLVHAVFGQSALIQAGLLMGIELVLAHEVPGISGQAERSAVTFGNCFSSSQTPIWLIKAGI